MLLIWDPERCSHLKGKLKAQQELYYRTRGIVEYDRVLNDEKIFQL